MAAAKVDRAPVQGGTGTRDEKELYPESSRSLDGLREMRLKALLMDMIGAADGKKAAQALGVSYRTVSRAIESGRLTERMRAALERHLLLGGGAAAAAPAAGEGGVSGEAGGHAGEGAARRPRSRRGGGQGSR